MTEWAMMLTDHRPLPQQSPSTTARASDLHLYSPHIAHASPIYRTDSSRRSLLLQLSRSSHVFVSARP